jgi:hypothetical protein
MSSHGLLNCYQHHAFQQHLAEFETLFTAKPLQQTPPKQPLTPLQANTQLSLNIGIKFYLNN